MQQLCRHARSQGQAGALDGPVHVTVAESTCYYFLAGSFALICNVQLYCVRC